MATLTSYETGNDTASAIGDVGGNEYGHAQSFQISERSSITEAQIYVEDGTSPPTDPITVRIETDNAGLPSGNLVHANATSTILAANVPDNGSPAFTSCTFSAFTLNASTTYHLTATMPDQAAGVNFQWYRDAGDGAYANGVATRETNGSWGALNGGADDMLFKIIGTVSPSSNFLVFL